MNAPEQPMAGEPAPTETVSSHQLLADRRRKLERLRNEFQIDPFGHRIDGLLSIEEALARYDAQADEAFKAAEQTARRNPDAQAPVTDARPCVHIAGRVMQHRVMGSLIFLSVRDASGDIQVAVSKKLVGQPAFGLAKMADLADLVVASGRLGTTQKGEISVWCLPPTEEERSAGLPEGGFVISTKSLALPPGKWHGLQDPELRYRKRYVDMYANPQVIRTFQTRSRLVAETRRFLAERGFLEVETPMMQPIPGGAAARPFTTHHNALDLELFLRIAPELYLKRLLVGGLPRVFEINRNFRNEGVDRSHNPEFTMLELYEAYGDLYSVMDLTEQLIQTLARNICGSLQLPFGEAKIDYSCFRRARYLDLFAEHNDFDGSDHARLLERARNLNIENPQAKDPQVLLNEVWEETVESHLIQPTFVIDYPGSLCPLTKRKPQEPEVAERFELFVCGMELANAYTELNDPDVQEANFRQQVAGLDEEEATFRNVDEDFLESLRVGMPPAGGLGVGIDRLVMLLTNNRSIRDVILFPLMRPQS